jgi:hypothetical protein
VARGASSRVALAIDWKHPTHSAKTASKDGASAAVQQRAALGLAEAMAAITGDDPRPVLVLRECLQCSGTEDALMSSKEDNERTYLLSRWFHCIKLPPDVLEPDHPFHALFAGEKPAHLFLANRDGSRRHDLEGEHSRRELWDAMDRLIVENYRDSYTPVLLKLGRCLDQLDEADQVLADLETRYELALGEGKGESSGTVRLAKEIEQRRERRQKLLAEIDTVSKLEPKTPPAAAGG